MTKTCEQNVVGTWLFAQMKGLGFQMCLLTVSAIFGHRKLPKIGRKKLNSCDFLNMGIYEIVNTPSNREAVGAFLCFTNTSLLTTRMLINNIVKIHTYWKDIALHLKNMIKYILYI